MDMCRRCVLCEPFGAGRGVGGGVVVGGGGVGAAAAAVAAAVVRLTHVDDASLLSLLC